MQAYLYRTKDFGKSGNAFQMGFRKELFELRAGMIRKSRDCFMRARKKVRTFPMMMATTGAPLQLNLPTTSVRDLVGTGTIW